MRKSLLSLDVKITDKILKHDREIEIGESTSKTLKKLRQERAIMDMGSFYCTNTRCLTRHLPFANELFFDLAILHPLMLKESQVVVVCLPRPIEVMGWLQFSDLFTELPVPSQVAGVVGPF